jgi:hypothetical protein
MIYQRDCPDTEEAFAEYREKFQRRREGVWFMIWRRTVYLLLHHYMGMQWNIVEAHGGYKDFPKAWPSGKAILGESLFNEHRGVQNVFFTKDVTGFAKKWHWII